MSWRLSAPRSEANGWWALLWKRTITGCALAKLEKKSCDLMVLNGPQAMHALDTQVEIIDPRGVVLEALAGTKEQVSQGIFRIIQQRLIDT